MAYSFLDYGIIDEDLRFSCFMAWGNFFLYKVRAEMYMYVHFCSYGEWRIIKLRLGL